MAHKLGDKVEVETKDNQHFTGIVMPNETSSILFIKLSSGYNIGIEKKKISSIEVLEGFKTEKKDSKLEIKENNSLHTISILHTGGTIASQVDYRTGAVISKFTPQDLLMKFPEISNIANIRSKLIFQMFSEDMEAKHWSKLAGAVADEIKNGSDGVIITHGTDTMAFTSAALSFSLQNLPIPVLIVGAQRSSDRPSSDAAYNIIAAAKFIAGSDYSGVGICMHKNEDDNSCLIHAGVSVRKMHSSRRDAFRSINTKPVAEIDYKTGKINFIRKDYIKKDKDRKLIFNDKFEANIAIVKMHPGFSYKELELYKKYKGLILEGTGLGHAPTNKLDEFTKDHPKLLESIKKMSQNTLIVMTTQTVYGAVNMNVYSTGRDLLEAGVISGNGTTTEAAFVKLSWVLAHHKLSDARREMQKNTVGENPERIENNTFLI